MGFHGLQAKSSRIVNLMLASVLVSFLLKAREFASSHSQLNCVSVTNFPKCVSYPICTANSMLLHIQVRTRLFICA